MCTNLVTSNNEPWLWLLVISKVLRLPFAEDFKAIFFKSERTIKYTLTKNH